MTARRDNTTLLRLRSSLITRNSSVFPSYGVASFTGRVSINEPGKKARMPLTMTVKPPFTLPVIVPEFFNRDIGFGFKARIDHDKIVIDANDLSRDDFASPHLLMGYRGLKQCGKRFLIGIGRRGRKKLGRHKKQKIRDIGPI